MVTVTLQQGYMGSKTSADIAVKGNGIFFFFNTLLFTQRSTSGLSLCRNMLFLAFEIIRRSPEAEHAAIFKCCEDGKMSFATELRLPLSSVDSADSSKQDWHSVFKGFAFYQCHI